MASGTLIHAVSGAGGGALSSLVTYPLITLSTRAQTEVSGSHKPILDAIREVTKKEGFEGLYAGIESAMTGITLTNFIYYYFYEGIKAIYLEGAPVITSRQAFCASILSGTGTALFTNPIWVVNTRMMLHKAGTQRTTWDVVKEVYNEGGLRLFMAGVGPSMLLVLNPVISYTILEKIKQRIERTRHLTPTDAFYCGALGKLAATCVTYPLITLKSRLQQKDNQGGALNGEGILGLYRGFGAKVTQSVLQMAFLFFFKEQIFQAVLKLLSVIRKWHLRRRGSHRV